MRYSFENRIFRGVHFFPLKVSKVGRNIHVEDSNLECLSLDDSYEHTATKNPMEMRVNKADDSTSINTETPSSGYYGDDTISPPFEEIIPNVLVVSHGALLRELLKYFVYDLRCEIPHDHSILKQVPVNTALSKFTVQISSQENELPNLTCHLFSDKEHLSTSNLETRTLCNM
jgi:hypothetical protein